MAKRYLSGEAMAAIGAAYDIHHGPVDSLLRYRGIPILSRSNAKRKYPLREGAFDIVADEPTAYWLGFLCADGCVVFRRGSGEVHLVLAERDIDHLERYREFFETQAPIRKETHHETYRVSLYSLRLAIALMNLGCTPKKSLTLQFPSLEASLVSHFIRGYFDGDGSAYFGGEAPSISFVGNKVFLLEVKSLIDAATNANGRLFPHTNSTVWYLIYRGQFKVPVVRDWLYQGASIWLKRKRIALEAFAPGRHLGYPTATFYVGTAGKVSETMLQRYTEAQKGT